MNIITYHAHEVNMVSNGSLAAQILHKNSRTGRKAGWGTAADMRLFSEYNNVQGHAQQSIAVYNRLAAFLWHNLLPILLVFSTLYAVFSVLLLRNGGVGSYSIREMRFAEEPSFGRALHAYIFPEQERIPEHESESFAPEYVSAVTFKDYTVKKGDTVSGITFRAGLRNFGTILSVNNIDNARKISAGQTLQIPSSDGLLHTVSKNETIAGIAAQYKVSVTTVLDANDLTQESLSVGQRLFIPGASLSVYELRKALGELFIYPIQGRLTSPFGYRSDPFTGARSFHSGIDLAAPIGTAVKVTLDGKVAETGLNRIFGNYIIVSHERGYQSLYGHLSAIYVKRGQSVAQGKIIGAVGSTGYSTGPHLHLSIYKNGRVINPFSVLK